MYDALNCYHEDRECSDCGKNPVQVIHWGSLTNGEKKDFCIECFDKRCDAEKETNRSVA